MFEAEASASAEVFDQSPWSRHEDIHGGGWGDAIAIITGVHQRRALIFPCSDVLADGKPNVEAETEAHVGKDAVDLGGGRGGRGGLDKGGVRAMRAATKEGAVRLEFGHVIKGRSDEIMPLQKTIWRDNDSE